MLVPEKLLFGGGTSKKIREFIVQNGKIYAIISLPAGALKPISGLKTSILVLGKGDQTSSYNIFMAHLDDFRLGDTFNIEELTDVNSVLKSYQSWKETGEISTNSFSWTISIDEIDIENFTVTPCYHSRKSPSP
jgi:type I restriction-modification system DNA methylase subunit